MITEVECLSEAWNRHPGLPPMRHALNATPESVPRPDVSVDQMHRIFERYRHDFSMYGLAMQLIEIQEPIECGTRH